ncbi:hypothetical protein B0H13DRAFT_2328530 [Mycena leptocephala]|nr:hypothetical protein B0H13DRAFT_2328530 [Mycena leptocephala]
MQIRLQNRGFGKAHVCLHLLSSNPATYPFAAPAVPPPCWPIQASSVLSQPIAISGVLFRLLHRVSGPLQAFANMFFPWLSLLPAAVQQPVVPRAARVLLLAPFPPFRAPLPAALGRPLRLGPQHIPLQCIGRHRGPPRFAPSACFPPTAAPLYPPRASSVLPHRFPPPLRGRCGFRMTLYPFNKRMDDTPRSLGGVRPLPARHRATLPPPPRTTAGPAFARALQLCTPHIPLYPPHRPCAPHSLPPSFVEISSEG